MNPGHVSIDTRPLPVVIFSKWWRFPVYLALAWALYHFYHAQPPEGLSPAGFRSLVVFITWFILVVFHLLPLPVTGLYAMAAPVLMGILSAKKAFSYFGSEPVFFILGVFLLAAALLKSGLSSRISLTLLKYSSSSPKKLVFYIMLSSALMSFLMSEHAVAAMMFPIILVITEALKFHPHGGSYGRTLFLSMAWGCVVGGIATMLGGARVPLAIGILEESGQGSIGFLEWTRMVIPVVVVLWWVSYFILTRLFRIDVDSVTEIRSYLEGRVHQLGRMSLGEKFLATLMVMTILSWIFIGQVIGLATIAILGVFLLFMFRVVEWKDLEREVDWGVILLYGGAVALSSIMESTGAGHWLAHNYFVPHIESGFILLAALALVSMVLTEAISNAAVVAILLPIGLTLAPVYHLDPRLIVFTVGSACGLAFIFPMSTPAIAIAYSSGYLRFRDVLLPGLLVCVSGWILLLLAMKFWWPLLGYSVP